MTKNLHYLTAGTGLFAIFATQTNGTSAMHYTLKDHQGSLAATICGNAVERLSYDAWGNLRNPETWLNYTAPELAEGPMFDRGYTGHEHISAFGLINMNGRCYDPVTSSFLSVDRFVQSPEPYPHRERFRSNGLQCHPPRRPSPHRPVANGQGHLYDAHRGQRRTNCQEDCGGMILVCRTVISWQPPISW